ncbi:hypothetical protein F5I97DRAFT_1935845 [Phlebopus sp. FC_14]|nr:hypothetical protein F5I97DRAFT_1935845 [Phlebopus sp. FC_14]
MTEHGEEYLAVLKVAYDYEPQSEDEITIKENQLLFLLEKTDDDWWKVKVKRGSQDEEGPTGLVPAAYIEQAEHTSLVKALYDYDAAAPGELSIRENEILMVFDREDEWILVQSQKEGGKAGFVPGNYVEESEPPARPVSIYVDPADLVAHASAKAQADDIRTWPVSEVDKKGKKRKGTLGIGNGAVFFASESDKTPVQKWQTTDVEGISVDKGKHVHIEVGGINSAKLHFNVGSKDMADAVVVKLESSKGLSSAKRVGEKLDGDRSPNPSAEQRDVGSPSRKNGASVRFAEESQIIPPRKSSEDVEVGEPAVALYDFEGTSSDELSVQEGERLDIIEKEGEEWWKCRNKQGAEGVVPASYLEVRRKRITQEGERLEAERQERAEKERRRAEQELRAQAATAAAEAEKTRRENEAATEAEAKRKKRQEAARHAQAKAEREQNNGPPPDGQFKVEAALLGYNNGKLRLHKINGVVIEVPSEKMSLEDMRYTLPSSSAVSTAQRRRREAAKQAEQPKKGPNIDWFEFFLSAGCDMDDCTRYSSSFERDKIDEAILPDITESTMRSLGLREGDIIRKFSKAKAVAQVAKEENTKKLTSPAPNLFVGPGGTSKTLPPPAVDLDAIGSSGSPLVRTSSPAVASPIQAPQRSSSVLNTPSGFDDDAWTNRPGSKPPAPPPTPPATAPRAPSAPPATQIPSNPMQSQETLASSLAKTDADIFDQLARLSQLKTNRSAPSPAPASAAPATSIPVVVSPPPGYNSGFGMGISPTPLGQHLQNQQTGVLPPPQQHGPRANQGLLQPLIPTQTGFNNFVPTRPANMSPFQSQSPGPFVQSQPTGFTGNSQPLISQPTGLRTSEPMLTQPTGIPFGNLTPNTSFRDSTAPPVPSIILSPYGQSPFNNALSSSPPIPSRPFTQLSSNSGSNTSPANVFAQMKSGTFAVDNERPGPQLAGKWEYDALRVQPQPTGLVPHVTSWSFQQSNGGFHSGYTGY